MVKKLSIFSLKEVAINCLLEREVMSPTFQAVVWQILQSYRE